MHRLALHMPHKYEVELLWKSRNTEGRVPVAAEREAILVSKGVPALFGAPPPQFGGPGGRWNPEDLLLASIELCLMTTFFAIAEKSDLPVLTYNSRATGDLDKTAEGLRFTKISVEVALGTTQYERGVELLQKAKKHCLISASLKQEVELVIHDAVNRVDLTG